jgi:hypothetical protein
MSHLNNFYTNNKGTVLEYFAKRWDICSCPENYSSDEVLCSSPKNLFRDKYFGNLSRHHHERKFRVQPLHKIKLYVHQGREIIAIVPLENGAFCTIFSENFHKF